MEKITLTDVNGNILGMGYMGESTQDLLCYCELAEQVARSGINATLSKEDTNEINMNELREMMRNYQITTDYMNSLMEDNETEEEEWGGYNIESILGIG